MRGIYLSVITVFSIINTLPAEVGFNLLFSAHYEAEFGVQPGIYTVNDPGPETGIADRFYDDGYNRIDSSGNAGDVTTYWGYQNPSQYDAGAGTITMNSQRLNLTQDARVTEKQKYLEPGLEFWWQTTLWSEERNKPYQPRSPSKDKWLWYLDIRAALRWQHIEMDQNGDVSGSLENLADVYSTGGSLPPPAPFDGTFEGPNMALDAIPSSRTITPLTSGTATAQYELQTEIFALDFGPSLIFDLDHGARFALSAGATLAWVYSDFDYRYGNFHSGNDSVSEPLLGWYASFDFMFYDGVVLGLATHQLQEVEHDGTSYAKLDFSNSYTLRLGLAF